MLDEKQIRMRMSFLKKDMTRLDKLINKKYVINKANSEKVEEYREMYYEHFTEMNALRWVLGERQD